MPTYKFKLLTQGDLFTYETEARTLGEFRNEIKNSADLCTKFGVRSSSDMSEIHLIERSTKTSYIMDNAVLPTNNALFFVSLSKSEGGVFGESFFSRDLNYDDLVELAEYLEVQYGAGFSYSPCDMSYDSLYEEIEEFYKEQNSKEEERIEIDFNDLSTKEKLEAVADILLDISLSMKEGYNEPIGICIDGVTFSKLDEEANALLTKLRQLGFAR